jgi:hypothetical protein
VIEGGDRPLVGQRAEDGPSDVAGQQLTGDEDDHAQQPQRDQREHQALQQKPGDRHASSSRIAGSASGVLRDGRFAASSA